MCEEVSDGVPVFTLLCVLFVVFACYEFVCAPLLRTPVWQLFQKHAKDDREDPALKNVGPSLHDFLKHCCDAITSPSSLHSVFPSPVLFNLGHPSPASP